VRTFLREFWLFGIKQASACLFGGYLLAMILLTKLWYPFGDSLYRNDFLFLSAVVFQIALLFFKLETLKEAVVILVFHLVAMWMEVFKTSDGIGSWNYPGEFRIGVGNVPMFAGFMYSAVGSYIARTWRLFDFRFEKYPPLWSTWVLMLLIYANFFSCHYIFDIRYYLVLLTLVLYGRTTVHFKVDKVHRYMPSVLSGFLAATFIWFAENISTYAGIWLYPNQRLEWEMVSPMKLVAWYLLIFVSGVIVSAVHPPQELESTDGAKRDG
jgi:uncharacterized membrane protein YoaT (DUF817 family)